MYFYPGVISLQCGTPLGPCMLQFPGHADWRELAKCELGDGRCLLPTRRWPQVQGRVRFVVPNSWRRSSNHSFLHQGAESPLAQGYLRDLVLIASAAPRLGPLEARRQPCATTEGLSSSRRWTAWPTRQTTSCQKGGATTPLVWWVGKPTTRPGFGLGI